tara:strand:- start:171 stop:728 length:558 start_codon:yes stop_codon:yes gene_type:complete
MFPLNNLEIKKIEEIENKKESKAGGVIFYNNLLDDKNFEFEDIVGDYLLIANIENKKNIKIKKIINQKKPIHINKIKDQIKNFLNERELSIGNIQILEKKLINKESNKFCFLTDIEHEILRTLIKQKNCSKEYIKSNILKIKSDIQTNSLESHLTRIRKKFEKIKTKMSIQSKNDKILIFLSQKN